MMVNSYVPRYSNLASELHRNYFFKFKLVLSSFRSNTHMMAPLCHRQPKLAVCVLGDFIDRLNISLSLSLKNEQVEMKTQIKKRVNKTLLTFYLFLLDVS